MDEAASSLNVLSTGVEWIWRMDLQGNWSEVHKIVK